MSAVELRKSINILHESLNQSPMYEEEPEDKKRIAITYEIVTPESAEHGDAEERGWIDEEGVDMTPDKYDIDDGLTAVSKAVEFLRNEGVVEASSSQFHQGVWYIGQEIPNYKTGAVETRSYHLRGFTPKEEQAVYALMI